MHIVVLTKPVPDPASGGERLGPDGRLDRAAAPAVVNGNDEYALEAALKLVEAHGGEVDARRDGAGDAPDTMRKAPGDGRHQRRPGHGSHAGRARTPYDDARPRRGPEGHRLRPLLAGVDTSDGAPGVVPAGVATLMGVPYLCYAAKIEPDPAAGTVRVRRISRPGYDVLEAPMPALIVVHPGARRAALPVAQGDHGRPLEGRSRRRALATSRGRRADRRRGGDDDGRRHVRRRRRGPRPGSSASPRTRPRAGRRLPRRAGGSSDGAASGSSASGADGRLAKICTEVATLARALGRGGRRGEVVGIVVAADPRRRGDGARPYVHRACSVTAVSRGDLADVVAPQRIADRVAANERGRPSWLLAGAEPEGRDVAGHRSSALTGLAASSSTRPRSRGRTADRVVEMSVFGGKLITHEPFTGDRGIVTVRPNAVTAAPAATAGTVERPTAAAASDRAARGRSRRARRRRRGRRRDRGGADHRRRRPRRRRAGRLRASSRSWPRRSAAPSARRGPRSTRAGSRTPSRSARPARS